MVVLPSVPVMPTTASSCDGSPYHHAAALASAGRVASTTSWGGRDPGQRPFDDDRRGARVYGRGHEVVAVGPLAGDRHEQRSRAAPTGSRG